MAGALIGWAWRVCVEKELSTGARLTLLAAQEHSNIGKHGDYRLYPSQARMAKMVGCSEVTLRKYLKELVDNELLVVAHQYDADGRQKPNLYWLQAPKLLPEEGERILPPEVKILRGEGKESYDKSLNKNPLKNNIRSKQFDAWYSSYPKKQSKKAALKAFMNLKPDALTACLADDLTARYKNTERKFIPLPSTYLNGERWDDEIDDAQCARTDKAVYL